MWFNNNKKLLNHRCVKADKQVRSFCNCPNGKVYPIVGNNVEQALNNYSLRASNVDPCNSYERCFGGNASPCMKGLVNASDLQNIGETIYCTDLPEEGTKKVTQSYVVCQVLKRDIQGNKIGCMSTDEIQEFYLMDETRELLSINDKLMPQDFNPGSPTNPISQKLANGSYISCWEVNFEQTSNIHCRTFELIGKFNGVRKTSDRFSIDKFGKSLLTDPSIIPFKGAFVIVYVINNLIGGLKILQSAIYNKDTNIEGGQTLAELALNDITKNPRYSINLSYVQTPENEYLLAFTYKFSTYSSIRFIKVDSFFAKSHMFPLYEIAVYADQVIMTFKNIDDDKSSQCVMVYSQGKVYEKSSNSTKARLLSQRNSYKINKKDI